MSYTSGFFDAVDLGGGDYDREYSAAVFAHYFSLLVKNGVFPDPSTGMQVKASSSPDMHVSVQPGSGWVNGYYITVPENGPEALTVPTANPSLSRIDSVIMGLNYVEREIQLYIKSGAVSASPSAVSLQRDNDLYEMELAQITVAAGVASISQANITDMRQNTSRCGIVKGTIDQIDTTDLFAQYDDAFQTWFADIQAQLSGDVATNLQNQINTLKTGKVNVSDKASTEQAQAGSDDTKWVTPAKVKALYDYRKATTSEAQEGTNDTKWMSPAKVKTAIGTAPKTVFDTATNRFVTVKSILDHFGMYTLPSIVSTSVQFYSTQSGYNYPAIHMARYKNKLLLFGLYYDGSSTYYGKYVVVNLDSGAVIKSGTTNTIGSGYRYNTYGYPDGGISADGSLAVFYSGNQVAAIDLENNAATIFSTSWFRKFFKSKSKWGYLYISNYNSRMLYYASLGVTSGFSSYNLGNATNSSYYDIELIGVYGDTLWFLDRSNQKEYKLSKIDLSTGSVTSGVALFSANSYNGLYMKFLVHDGSKAYIKVQFSPSSGNTKYGTHCLIVNLKDGSTNWSSVQNSLTEDINSAYNNGLYSGYYVGSTSESHFFVYTSCIIEVNRLSGAVTIHQLYETIDGNYLKTGNGCGKSVEFNIPGLEGCILFGSHILNTETKELYAIYGTPTNIQSSSYVTGTWRGYNSFSTCVCMFGGGNINDCDVVSMYGTQTNSCKVIGKEIYRAISTVNPIE